jgi:hypothetical protein
VQNPTCFRLRGHCDRTSAALTSVLPGIFRKFYVAGGGGGGGGIPLALPPSTHLQTSLYGNDQQFHSRFPSHKARNLTAKLQELKMAGGFRVQHPVEQKTGRAKTALDIVFCFFWLLHHQLHTSVLPPAWGSYSYCLFFTRAGVLFAPLYWESCGRHFNVSILNIYKMQKTIKNWNLVR